MNTNEILHIIRNPYGWNDHVVRDARLAAADLIEQQEKELEAAQKRIAELEAWLETLTDEARRQAKAEALTRRIDSYFAGPRWVKWKSND